jgi:hypothetical protein
MTRNALKLGPLGAIVLASLTSIFLVEHHAQSQWRERQELLREQAGKMAELAAENQSLGGIVAQATNSVLSREEFRELLKLRGEIGSLRQSAGELAELRLTHRELLAAIKNREMPEEEAALAYWPKAQLTPAGFANPEAALQTALCAMSQSDSNALLASVTPETGSMLASSQFPGGNAAERIAAATKLAADSLAPASGFYLARQELNSADQATLDVYFEGESATRQFVLRQIGGEWKLRGIYPANLDVAGAPMIWP